MKIAFLLPANGIAGGVFVTYIQAHALKRRGHDVTIIFSRINAQDKFLNYPEFSLNYITLESALLSNDEYDVVIATWWETFYDMFRICAQRYLYFVQSDERRLYRPDEVIQKHFVHCSYSFNNVGIITEAMWIKKMLESEFGASVEYAPNGVDTKIFNPKGTVLESRTEKFRVLIEGSSGIPYKRVADAFAAAGQIPNIEVWYVSPDGLVDPTWRIDRIFKSVPYIDMPAIYRSCDVLIKLSAVEGFFGPPLEMMACGNVSIVSNVTGYEEYIKDGYNALVVPIGDIDAAAAALRKLINEPNLRERLSNNGLETACNLDWEKQTPYFERALLNLVVSSPSIPRSDKKIILSLSALKNSIDVLRAERDQLWAKTSSLDYRALERMRNGLRARSPKIYFYLASLFRWAHKTWQWYSKHKRLVRPLSRNLFNTRIVINHFWPKDYPLVSVVIASYNYGAYLRETIDSVLAQTFQDFEIIVIDDGSTDDYTKQVLASLKTPKTRIIMQANHGLPVTRNNGIRAARGKYICCLDSDDCLKPTYLEKCLYWLETKNLDVCFSWVQEFGDSHGIWKTGPFSLDILKNGNSVSVSAVYRKSFWEKSGGYKKAMTHGYDDWEFWLTLAEHGARGHCIPEPLFLYRRHAHAMSKDMQVRYDQIYAQIKAFHPRLYASQKYLKKLRKQHNKHYVVIFPFRNMLRTCTKAAASSKGKINILFAVPWFDLGGVSVLKSSVFTRLANRDIAVTAVATNPSEGEYSERGLTIFEGYRSGNFNLMTYLRTDKIRFLEYLIKSRNIHILFLAGSRFMYENLSLLKRKFPDLKIVDELYNTVGHIANNREFSRYIDFNIVANEEVQDCLIKLGESANRIKVIPHGIDVEHFSVSNPTYIMHKGSRPYKEFTFGFLGRLSSEKCPRDFVKLADDLRQCQFRICGDGPLDAQIREEVRLANREQQIHVEGATDNPVGFLAGIDALIITSEIEGLPLVLLEAMAVELPVITTSVGRVPLVISHGYNGFLYEPGEMDRLLELAHQLTMLPENKRAIIGRRARETVLNEYTITECVDNYYATLTAI